MEIYYSIFFFLFGAAFGSFYNVVGMRWPAGKSIVQPGSHCDACQKPLMALDLIPVLSYVLLRGKCRQCGEKFGAFHALIELFTGLLFILAYVHFGFTAELIVALLFISLFAIITVSDICYMIIQDKVLLIFGSLIVIGRIISPLTPWWDTVAGAVFGFGLLLLVSMFSKNGMGGGDIKLYFVIGLVLGVKLTFISIFLSSVIGLIVAVFLKRGFGKTIPFGPSIAVGSLIAYFYGSELFDWYTSLFF